MTTGTALVFWLVGALIGSMLFFAVTVAPTVFRVLSAEHAGTFLRAFLPTYYLWGLIVALIAASIAMNTSPVVSVACSLVALLFVFSRQTLMPYINHACDQERVGIPGTDKRFSSLHLWSVAINGFQILILFTVAGMLLWNA